MHISGQQSVDSEHYVTVYEKNKAKHTDLLYNR